MNNELKEILEYKERLIYKIARNKTEIFKLKSMWLEEEKECIREQIRKSITAGERLIMNQVAEKRKLSVRLIAEQLGLGVHKVRYRARIMGVVNEA